MNELIRVRDNTIEVEGFDYEELTDILEHICVSWHLVPDLSFSILFRGFPGEAPVPHKTLIK